MTQELDHAASILSNAVSILRFISHKATPGPWEVFRRGDPAGPFGVASLTDPADSHIFYGAENKADAILISIMSPSFANLAADWLELVLESLESETITLDELAVALRAAEWVIYTVEELVTPVPEPHNVIQMSDYRHKKRS